MSRIGARASRRRLGVRMGSEAGSATMWAIALLGVVVLLAVAGVQLAAVVQLRHRAQTAADLAAIAGAQSIGNDSAHACVVAAAVVTLNQAVLRSCVPAIEADGRAGSIRVEVSVRGGRWVAVARAHAGRLAVRAMTAVWQHDRSLPDITRDRSDRPPGRK